MVGVVLGGNPTIFKFQKKNNKLHSKIKFYTTHQKNVHINLLRQIIKISQRYPIYTKSLLKRV
jgi:hypothetical protein